MSVKLRVLLDAHMVGHRETGNETYVTNLARTLSEIEQVQCATAVSDRCVAPKLGAAQCIELRPRGNWARLLYTLPLACRNWRADILHASYVAPFAVPCPFVVSVHDISFKRYPEFFSPKDRLLFATLLPATLRRTSAVITISEFCKREILEQFPYLRDRVHVTLLAAGVLYKPVDKQRSLREVQARFGIQQEFVLAVGNLQPRKNLLRLIRAFALASQRVGKVQLAVVGRAQWQASDVLGEVTRLGLLDRVVFTGYVDDEDLLLLYNTASAFVYPSLYEGFGLPVLEAMACGTPVVTSNTSSLPEVAGDAAILVNPYEEEEIAAAIEKVFSDAQLKRTLSEAGLRQAASFTWQRTAMETLAVYKQVIDG